MIPTSDITALRDGFAQIAAKAEVPEAVRDRNAMLRDLMDELLELREEAEIHSDKGSMRHIK